MTGKPMTLDRYPGGIGAHPDGVGRPRPGAGRVECMSGQTIALVTGANKGIGYEIAAGLGALGWSVGVSARDEQRREAAVAKLRAAGVDAFGVPLDVTDDASVDAAARLLEGRAGRLDVLVKQGRLIHPADHSPAAETAPISAAYAPSKTFLSAVTIQYAKELRDTNILINAACPGFTATDLNGFRGVRTPEQGAAIAIRLATLPDDGPTGGFFEDAGVVPW